MREASRRLFSDISAFMNELRVSHPMQGIEEHNDVRNRQKPLVWLEDTIGTLCETLNEPARHPAMESFRTSICESVDSVLLSLVDAIKSDDAVSWEIARQITGDQGGNDA